MTTFADLPLELRRQIWASTVEPRTVPVRLRLRAWATAPSRAADRLKEPMLTLMSSAPVPNIMHVCRESQSQGLYQRFFLSEEANTTYVWVDLDIDIIDIGDYSYYEDYKHCGHLIRRLKFEASNTSQWWYYGAAGELSVFDNLVACFVLAQDGWEQWGDAVNEHYWSCEAANLYIIDKDRGRMMAFPEVKRWMDSHNRHEKVGEVGVPLPVDLAATLTTKGK